MAFAKTGMDDEIGPRALVYVSHLAREDGGKSRFGHSLTRQNARALNTRGRGHDDARIDPPPIAALEEQWDVEDDHLRAAHSVSPQKIRLRGGH